MCLANSTKLGERCIAGVCVDSREWIRPLGSGRSGAVTYPERRLDTGAEPALLDLIDVPLLHPCPTPGSPEDWRLAEEPWKHVGHLSGDEALNFLTALATDEPLFGSSARAFPITHVLSGHVPASLAIVRPSFLRLVLKVWEQPEWQTYRSSRTEPQLRAHFEQGGAIHNFPVTDPDRKNADPEDAARIGQLVEDGIPVFLTVSLGQPFLRRGDPEERQWKLVAAIIRVDPD